MQRREISIGNIPYSAGGLGYLDIPKVGHGETLIAHLTGTLTIASAVAAGTLVALPFNPLGLISAIYLDEVPAGPAGMRTQIPAQNLFFDAFRLQRQLPFSRTIANGSNQTSTPIDAYFQIPLTTLHPNRKAAKHGYRRLTEKSQFRVWIQWPATDAAAMATLVTGNTSGVATFTSLRVEFSIVDHVGADQAMPRFKNALKSLRQPHAAAGVNAAVLSIAPGELFRGACLVVVDNTARSDSILANVNLKVGPDIVRTFKYDDLQRKNISDFGIRAADWPVGVVFLDMDTEGNFAHMTSIPAAGYDIRVELDTGSTNPTASSYTDISYETVSATPEGLRAAGIA